MIVYTLIGPNLGSAARRIEEQGGDPLREGGIFFRGVTQEYAKTSASPCQWHLSGGRVSSTVNTSFRNSRAFAL
jgi:hypothetical protein